MLLKRLCANYDNGSCLALDDGEPCACVQSISYSLLCKYFRKAVLPAEPLLEADILGTRFEKCVSCGAPIIKKDCINLPAILLVDRVFRIGEGGIFLLGIVAVAVASEYYR